MRTILAASALVLAMAAGAQAQDEPPEKRVPLTDQTGVAVTVYNDDLALVKDRRAVTLDKGDSLLAFEGVSNRIQAPTALLRGDVAVVEQSLDFGLLTPQTLLEKSVGRQVSLARINPATGAETIERGRILSVANGQAVLEVNGRIETALPGRIVYDSLPPGLRERPTLLVRVAAKDAGKRDLELSYLTGGLSWQADYVAELAPAEDKLDLKAWVTLTNASGAAYKDARLQLVAGRVNRTAPLMGRGAMIGALAARPAPAPAPKMEMQQEVLAGGHLYSLDRPITLADNQTKQVSLLGGAGITVTRDYIVEDDQSYSYQSREPQPNEDKASVVVSFVNSEKNSLGQPLPQGVVRVYKRDSAGSPQFVGEDRIGHTAAGSTVRLHLGEDFDLPVKRVQTAFQQIAERVTESAYELRLRNAKAMPVTVKLRETLPGDWQITQESLPHATEDGKAVWSIPVPAGGETVLSFRARVKM